MQESCSRERQPVVPASPQMTLGRRPLAYFLPVIWWDLEDCSSSKATQSPSNQLDTRAVARANPWHVRCTTCQTRRVRCTTVRANEATTRLSRPTTAPRSLWTRGDDRVDPPARPRWHRRRARDHRLRARPAGAPMGPARPHRPRHRRLARARAQHRARACPGRRAGRDLRARRGHPGPRAVRARASRPRGRPSLRHAGQGRRRPAGEGSERAPRANRCARQQCGPHHRRSRRGHGGPGLRRRDGHELLGPAPRDPGGAPGDAPAPHGAHREYRVDRGHDRHAPSPALQRRASSRWSVSRRAFARSWRATGSWSRRSARA